jgi:hypothetical protein
VSAEQIGFSTPVARIEHHCSLCDRTIEPGEQYARHRMVGDDGPYVWKECAHCRALMKVYGSEIVWDWYEGWGDEDVREWEPSTAEGREAQAHWRARWRGPDGALYPVPVAPDSSEQAAS